LVNDLGMKNFKHASDFISKHFILHVIVISGSMASVFGKFKGSWRVCEFMIDLLT